MSNSGEGKEAWSEFQSALRSCLGPFRTSAGVPSMNAEEIKTSAEVAAHNFIEASRKLESYFTRKYQLFCAYLPEEALKEACFE
ncbi:hypothetical protein D918_09534 [Trichuris suis]|nr:hypothetical protein D918_09534 [Trichuris suis]